MSSETGKQLLHTTFGHSPYVRISVWELAQPFLNCFARFFQIQKALVIPLRMIYKSCEGTGI